MAFSLDEFLDPAEHDARSHTGVPGVSSFYGDGGLGDVVLNSLLETSGDRNYNTLEVQGAGVIAATAGRKLVIRAIGNITVDGAIHADGRGFPGTAGGQGGSGAGSPGFVGGASPLNGSPAMTGGGAGGGGGGTGSAGGDALDQNFYRSTFASLDLNPLLAGGTPGGGGLPGNTGTSPAGGINSDELARYATNFGAKYRADSPLGRGGTGGGGGGAHPSLGGTGGAGGAAGSQTGANLGNGGNGVAGLADGGGGGGGGGAGGGDLEVWCGADLTVGSGGRISARGGNGGNSGDTSGANASQGGGGAGGGGGGGFVGAFYAGALSNLGSIDANAGTSGSIAGAPGRDGGSAGTPSAGVALIVAV